MIWVNAAKQYLAAVVCKDTGSIEHMLDDKVELRDWHTRVVGKDKVLLSNRRFADGIKTASLKINNTAYKDKYVCLECELTYEPVFELNMFRDQKYMVMKMVYIIEFNEWGKIKSIRSYKS